MADSDTEMRARGDDGDAGPAVVTAGGGAGSGAGAGAGAGSRTAGHAMDGKPEGDGADRPETDEDMRYNAHGPATTRPDSGSGVGSGVAGSGNWNGNGKENGGGKQEEDSMEEWRQLLKRGQRIDVLDTHDYWCSAMVAELGETTVLVHYTYWTSQWDERISRRSSRLAPYGSRIYLEGGAFQVGQRLDVFDEYPTKRCWTEARVIEVHEDRIRVHFAGFTSKFDEDIAVDSDRIKPFGTYTRKVHPYRPVAQTFWKHRRRARYIMAEDPRLHSYRSALQEKGLTVYPQIGDGNCLFRSVSHQVYGTADHHETVRQRCCDYMEKEASWYCMFVASDREGFLQYVAEKRRDGEWGDDPEIQAMCELYDRPAEIYVFDPVAGAKLLRTFHEGSAGSVARPPIRLSYYGGGHYDSIVGTDTEENHIKSAPGVEEARILHSTEVRSRVAGERKMNAVAADEDAALDAAIQRSRDDFDNEGRNLEAAMLASMGMDYGDGVLGDVAGDPAAAALQASMMEELRRKAEAEQLARATELSLLPDDADEAMARAIEMSRAEASAGDADADLARALELSRQTNVDPGPSDPDADFARALAMSMAAGGDVGAGAMGVDEETELSIVLALSQGADAVPRSGSYQDTDDGAGAGL